MAVASQCTKWSEITIAIIAPRNSILSTKFVHDNISVQRKSSFQLRQQFYMSQYTSVCGQRVLLKCYAVVSVRLLLLLLQFITFEHSVVIFCILVLHLQLRTQLCRSQCQPVGLSVCNEFYGSVMLLLMYDCCY